MKLSTEDTLAITLKKNLGRLSSTGALIVKTTPRTGRSVKERFVVQHPELLEKIAFGSINQPIDPQTAREVADKAKIYFQKNDFYEIERYVGPFPIHVRTTSPWHINFCNNMFRTQPVESVKQKVNNPPQINIYHLPHMTLSELGVQYAHDTLIVFDPKYTEVIFVGTAYAGEIKKSAFSMCNYLLPQWGIFPMHASANCLNDGSNACVLFGLSGTGKTTLSADPNRALIGDDEIIWTDNGLSNLEGGCYAKLVNLTLESEPEIYKAVNRPGAILENVVTKKDTNEVNFFDIGITENTRGSYPLCHLEKVFNQQREASHPKTIVFLTADAFGALPAAARLNSWQAQFHFLSGYTAKVAGTEMGIQEPIATFSACFGAPFMPRHPATYSKMLSDFCQAHNVSVWLLNTGWTRVDGELKRFPLKISRKLLELIQGGEALETARFTQHPQFGFEVLTDCPGIESQWLQIPQGKAVEDLVFKFQMNAKNFAAMVDPRVIEKGAPRNQNPSADLTSTP